jgi:hypothetical protein
MVTRPPPKVSKSPPAKRSVGRPGGDPQDIRSERLVQKIHPDLMAVFIQRAREAGVTRSAYIERVLLHHARFVEGAELDNIGRRIPTMTLPRHPNMRTMGQAPAMLPNGKPAIRYPSDENPLTEGDPGEDG